MSFYYLPCPTDYWQTIQVTLESEVYDFTYKYNSFDESWKLFIGLTGEDPACSFKLRCGVDLLKPFKYLDGVPDGWLYLIDTLNNTGRIGADPLNEFGIDKRFRMWYINSDTDFSTEVEGIA